MVLKSSTMNSDIFANLKMPYLQAIQKLSGDTASEKLSWIGRFASETSSDTARKKLSRLAKNVNRIGRLTPECEDYNSQLPRELELLYFVELAVKFKDSVFLAQALKVEDTLIVNRALKATWLFEGTDKIVNSNYFCKNILPFVSVRTRTRIVKTFGRRVKNPTFAQHMFTELEADYDIKTALPLIVCCEDNFIFDTIVKRKLLLPSGILKKIFRRNLELGLWLLVEYIQCYKKYLMNTEEFMKKKLPLHVIHVMQVIRKYDRFLPILAKHKPQLFADVINSEQSCTEIIKLSNKCAKKFLKEAIDIVAEAPQLYLPILPAKAIEAKQMEILLPGLIKYDDICSNVFHTDKFLTYLSSYSVNERLELLFNAYKKFYDCDLLDNIENVTSELLQLLPTNQRSEIAEKLMEIYPRSEFNSYSIAWICYFPVKKSIPTIQRLLKQASESERKVHYISHMLYTCIVNKDQKKLSEILKNILKKKYIENMNKQVFEELINNIMKICNLPYVTLKNGTLLCKIIEEFFEMYGYVQQNVLEDLVYFRLYHKLKLTDLMSMLFKTNDNKLAVHFYMITSDRHYERECLLACVNFIEKFYIYWYEEESQEEQQKNEIKRERKRDTLCRLVVAMYDFNKKCQRKRTERMTIKDYPKLLDAIRTIMCSRIDFSFRKSAEKVLRIHEGELYRSWFLANTSEDIADVTSGAALRVLKHESQSVLDNWEKYLRSCKKYYCEEYVQRFLRAIRWYKDIPLKFVKHCIDNLYGKNIQEMSSDLIILGILLESETFKELLTFVFKEVNLYNNCVNIRNTDDPTLALILRIFTLCNLPVPMEIVASLFTESKSFVGQMKLLRVIVRVPFDNMSLFQTSLPMMCMLMRKRWIDIMCSIGSLHRQTDFLYVMWQTEKNWIVREHILEKSLILLRDTSRLFLLHKNPNFDLLRILNLPSSLLRRKISTSFTLQDVHLLKKWEEHFFNIDMKCMFDYCDTWLNAINCLSEAGLQSELTRKHTLTVLEKLDSLNFFNSLNLAPDYLYCIKELFLTFLFHHNADISSAMRHHALLKISESFHKNANNCKLYWKIIADVLVYIKTYRQCDFPVQKSDIYHMINATHVFLNEFVIRYIKLYERSDYAEVIDNLQSLFSSKLSRLLNAKTYLLLKYARILYNCKKINSFREDNFGRELCHYLPDLIDTYSEFLVSVMAEILELFVKIIYGPDNYSNIMDLILDGLVSVDYKYAIFMTMMILPSIHQGTQYYLPDIL